MREYWHPDPSLQQERPLDIPEGERPDFNDLLDNAEAGSIRRGIAGYLFTHNPERSLQVHRAIGSPIVRKVVMGTVGRLVSGSGQGGNYRLDHSRSRIESATNFAVRGSVVNEIVHTVTAIPLSVEVVGSIAENSYDTSTAINAAFAGLNWALVALQRYNRARMVQRVNEELAEGNGFRSSYENWLGIDARAVENFKDTREPRQTFEADTDLHADKLTTLRSITPNETY